MHIAGCAKAVPRFRSNTQGQKGAIVIPLVNIAAFRNANFFQRFEHEVGLWRELQHPSICRLYGIAFIDDAIYSVCFVGVRAEGCMGYGVEICGLFRDAVTMMKGEVRYVAFHSESTVS